MTVDTSNGTTRRNPEETRRRILEAATAEFARVGFEGGRIDRIARGARANQRMIYHYFGDKAGLYIAVLEQALGELRAEELRLDVDAGSPREGVLQLFDFISAHFEGHPELVKLLSGENLLEAAHLKRSDDTPVISSPILALVEDLLRRGAQDSSVRADIDPLHLYVAMVGLSYFHLSNAWTLSVIFKQDLQTTGWRSAHRRMARAMLSEYLEPPKH
ncbi:MAG: TetR/AcrR family transcriptional regulator [Minwuia sp.]|uniref:TetR/AcrR family transcriptional regulator n=1 Tax=Minwuia sp. TaxID=2493630 RepID=UPI003A8A9355